MAAVKSTASVLYKVDEYGTCKELGFDPQKLSTLPGIAETYSQHSRFFRVPEVPLSEVCTTHSWWSSSGHIEFGSRGCIGV